MDNSHPLTPVEIRESRRFWRSWSRWYSKHYGNCGEKGASAFMAAYRAWLKFASKVQLLGLLTKLLKALALTLKFCNGLSGVSLTDSLPAPAI
jgi:hypothetical protein